MTNVNDIEYVIAINLQKDNCFYCCSNNTNLFVCYFCIFVIVNNVFFSALVMHVAVAETVTSTIDERSQHGWLQIFTHERNDEEYHNQ